MTTGTVTPTTTVVEVVSGGAAAPQGVRLAATSAALRAVLAGLGRAVRVEVAVGVTTRWPFTAAAALTRTTTTRTQ